MTDESRLKNESFFICYYSTNMVDFLAKIIGNESNPCAGIIKHRGE